MSFLLKISILNDNLFVYKLQQCIIHHIMKKMNDPKS